MNQNPEYLAGSTSQKLLSFRGHIMTSRERHQTRQVTEVTWFEFQVNSGRETLNVALIGCKPGTGQEVNGCQCQKDTTLYGTPC